MSLLISTIFRTLYRLPALWRGMRVMRAIERQQRDLERERLDRIRQPDRYLLRQPGVDMGDLKRELKK